MSLLDKRNRRTVLVETKMHCCPGVSASKLFVQAYSSKCTHYGAPLASGHLEGGLIRWRQD